MSFLNVENNPRSEASGSTSHRRVSPSTRGDHRQRGDFQGSDRGARRGRGRGGYVQPNQPNDGPGQSLEGAEGRGRGRGRGGWRGRGGRGGRGGGGRNGGEAPRPTHFLALPLHNHSTLRTRVGSFQNALLEHNPVITGLDSSIVIDPRRLHLTLGVMALSEPGEESQGDQGAPSHSLKTVESALSLLRSLRPQISQILNASGGGSGVKVPLEVLDVFPPGSTTGANVLFSGPDMNGIDQSSRHPSAVILPSDERRRWKERLWSVANFVHQEFKNAGYIVETRPLKLHCTILNASHRKPRRRLPFSYEDILNSSARAAIATSISTQNDTRRGLPALPVEFGVYDVNDIQLWVMGSHGPNNEYVNLGGIKLEPVF